MAKPCSSSYRMNELMKFFNARRNAYHANPKLIDDVIYTPYVYEIQPKSTDSPRPRHSTVVSTGDLLGIPELRQETPEDDDRTVRRKKRSFFDTTSHEAEIFMFQYGTVVIWGMTEAQERRFLASMSVFFKEVLFSADIESQKAFRNRKIRFIRRAPCRPSCAHIFVSPGKCRDGRS